jgi:hypothetical protein
MILDMKGARILGYFNSKLSTSDFNLQGVTSRVSATDSVLIPKYMSVHDLIYYGLSQYPP